MRMILSGLAPALAAAAIAFALTPLDAVTRQQNLPRPAAWGRQEERREGVPGDRGGEAPSPEANPELAI